MFRSAFRKLSRSLTTSARRPARAPARRAALSVEGLEDRMVLSTATLAGSVLQVTADPGTFLFGFPGHPPTRIVRQITFQADQAHPSKLDVLDSGTLLGQFPVASVKNVQVSVAGLDAVNVDDGNGLPFAAGTNISLFGSSPLLEPNSLNLRGSRTVSGGETYLAGNGAQAAELSVGGSTYVFTNSVGSVSDTLKTTAPLVVKAFGRNVVLSGQDGVTQTLTGLSFGGAGDTLTFGNKNLVNLEMLTPGSDATLSATAAAAGEKFFVVDLLASNQGAFVRATPSTVDTSVVDAGLGDLVTVTGNAGRVFINGSSSTLAVLGAFDTSGTTAGIQRDVFVNGVGRLALSNAANTTKQEHVTITESTISGTGLFGNNAVTVHYSNTGLLQVATGQLANTYTVVGSKPGARFNSRVEIDDDSTKGLSASVFLDSGSGLHLSLLNTSFHPAPASLFISALHGTFSKPTPTVPDGTEFVTFAGGLASEVDYEGFTSVSHS
jgi:hypothetical protein